MKPEDMAKMILEILFKENDLPKTIATLTLVQDEIKKLLKANIEQAKNTLEYHHLQAKMFDEFLTLQYPKI